jgi:hypothetical protein
MSFNEDDNIIVHNIEEKVTWKEAVISATPKPRPFVKIKGDNFRSIDSQFVHYDLSEIKYPFKCEDTSTSKPPKDHQPEDILCMVCIRFFSLPFRG